LIVARIKEKRIGAMYLFKLVERDPAGTGVLDRLPFGRLSEKVKSTIHRDSPRARSVQNERTGPSVIVVDSRCGRQESAQGENAVVGNLGTENRPKPRRMETDHDQ
jgi:hypothetical protein